MRKMAVGSSQWKLFSTDVAHPEREGYTTHESREQALWVACHSHWTEPAVRIEGPNGEIISREQIQLHCRYYSR